MTTQSTDYQDTAAMIAEKIGSYYEVLQDKKALHKLIREVAEIKLLDFYIEQHYEEALEEMSELLEEGQISEEEAKEHYQKLRDKALFEIDQFYKFDDILLGFKSRSTKEWDPAFDELLLENNLLPLAKSVLKKDGTRYNIASFAHPNEKYLRIHEKLQVTKEEKEAQKQALKDVEIQQKKALQLKTIDELILLFKSNKQALQSLEKIYEQDRADLMVLMNQEKIDTVYANEEETLLFNILERSGGYDAPKIAQNTLQKKFIFFFAPKSDGSVSCKDWFTNESFTFTKATVHDGHTLSFLDNQLWVDGTLLPTAPVKDVSLLKKKDYKEVEELKWQVASGDISISGIDFLRQCKTSTTLVEKLIDNGQLPPNVMDKYRVLGSEENISIIFEMVEEETSNNRKFFFIKKKQKQAARYEKLQRLQA